MSTSERLSQVYESSDVIDFNSSSKFIFFSDCHRGDNTWSDNFAHNEQIFLAAMRYYFDNGYIYIELGDGDELWENIHFPVIRECHKSVFKLMSKFHINNKLYMVWGNHDILKRYKKFRINYMYKYYDRYKEKKVKLFDKIRTHEGLILKHKDSGIKIFAVHGHQGDLINDQYWLFSRFLVRFLWKPLELIGFKNPTSPAKNYRKKRDIEKRIINWTRKKNQMIITGHTHRPMFPKPGSNIYFNCGCCIHPNGITGIEISSGEISLIKWHIITKENGALYAVRKIIAGPQKLESFI